MNFRIRRRAAATVVAFLAGIGTLLSACAPALDWREVRPDGSELQLLFPCRPSKVERRLKLADVPVTLTLMSCTAGSLTWGMAYADVADPTKVDAALAALAGTAAGNVGAANPTLAPHAVPGATPQAHSGRLRLQGRLPDGQAVRMQSVVFARGTQVFQASAVGQELSDEAAETFLASLRFAVN